MTVYNPINAGQITSNDAEGSRSCVSYSFSYAITDATNGRVHPTGRTIRDWTGDHMGGLELDQVDYAVFRNTGINFQTGVYTAGQFYGKLASGYGAILLGGYRPIGDTKFDGSPGFIGNHAIYVPPGLRVMDPLADGRRSGVYLYHGEAYPSSLINAFAAALRLGNGAAAGAQHFECSFVHLESAPIRHFRVTVDPGKLAYYPADASTRKVAQTGSVVAVTKGFTATCTAPARFVWTGHGMALTLVHITGNPHKGKWINAANPRVHVKEV